MSEAPGTQLDLTLATIRSARKSLFINIYELTEPTIADAIEDRIRAGVHVEMLLEGQPVAGRSTASQAIQAQLIKAMRKYPLTGSRFFEMTSKSERVKRRYRFDHAKYIVVDGDSLLVSSENFTPTGNPQPGTLGNRGWQVRVFQPEITREFFQMFREDSDLRYGDVISWLDAHPKGCEGVAFLCTAFPAFVDAAEGLVLGDSTDGGQGFSGGYVPSRGLPVADVEELQKILSPDNSLEQLVRMIRSARHSIDLQQMSFYAEWRNAGTQSPLITELLAAARRGVTIRILLNDDLVFLPPGTDVDTKNRITVRGLNQIAQAKRLKLSAKIADLKAMGVTIIHNKGAIIDNERVLISSINWNENSVTNNREAALLLKSFELSHFYGQLFEHDWRMSAYAIPPISKFPAAAELQD